MKEMPENGLAKSHRLSNTTVVVATLPTKPSPIRYWQIVWLNLIIGLVLAITFWLAQTKINHRTFSDELTVSFIHSSIYTLSFGLAMSYLGERLFIIHSPWNWISIGIALVFIAFLSTFIIELLLIKFGLLSLESSQHSFFFKSLGVLFIALIVSLCIYYYEKIRDQLQATNLQLQTRELEKERALKLVTEARLASLESQLHPHFLFNTLNSISALISEDAVLADETVQRLASLLRNSLDAVGNNKVLLKDEIKLVTDYLEIEKTRFRERLTYSIEIDAELENLSIPPLVLQPIVENSVKFAVAPNPEGGKITVIARRDEQNLIFEVHDDGSGFSTEILPDGHGLDNLQSRLIALFGESANLSFGTENSVTMVAVTLPINGDKETE